MALVGSGFASAGDAADADDAGRAKVACHRPCCLISTATPTLGKCTRLPQAWFEQQQVPPAKQDVLIRPKNECLPSFLSKPKEVASKRIDRRICSQGDIGKWGWPLVAGKRVSPMPSNRQLLTLHTPSPV